MKKQPATKGTNIEAARYRACASRGASPLLCFLCLLWLIPLSSAQEPRTVWDGVYSEAQAKRGEGIYVNACSNCHGRTLEGQDMTPALTGGVFMSNWDGLSVGDLTDRIRTSMPLDRPGLLSRQENVDVVAYILRYNQFPAGKDELPPQINTLKQIVFKAAKP